MTKLSGHIWQPIQQFHYTVFFSQLPYKPSNVIPFSGCSTGVYSHCYLGCFVTIIKIEDIRFRHLLCKLLVSETCLHISPVTSSRWSILTAEMDSLGVWVHFPEDRLKNIHFWMSRSQNTFFCTKMLLFVFKVHWHHRKKKLPFSDPKICSVTWPYGPDRPHLPCCVPPARHPAYCFPPASSLHAPESPVLKTWDFQKWNFALEKQMCPMEL